MIFVSFTIFKRPLLISKLETSAQTGVVTILPISYSRFFIDYYNNCNDDDIYFSQTNVLRTILVRSLKKKQTNKQDTKKVPHCLH